MMDAHALLIGISNYAHVKKLKKACNDARSMQALLVDPQACGYPAAQLTLLEDETATRDAIYDGLEALAKKATAQSVAFIFFAGHGARVHGGPYRGEYLCPVAADLSSAEAAHNSCISGDELKARLRKIQANKVVVALDCCHSAGLAEARGDERGDGVEEGAAEELQKALLHSGPGRVVFAASRPDERSFERAADHNGLFTKHLVAGLRGGAGRGDDRFVRVFDLYAYVQPRVTTEEPRQHPVFMAELEENFPLALCAGGRGAQVMAAAAEPPPLPPSYSRDALLAILYGLLPTQFDEVIFRLNIPPQHEPPIYLTQGQRAMAVIRWVESPGSAGLPGLVAKLQALSPQVI